MKPMLLFALLCGSIVIGWKYGINLGLADQYDSRVVSAIVGEASNQGPDCMRFVAHAIRNRGSLDGVYGKDAKHSATEPDWVWSDAEAAWEIAKQEGTDPTHGSNSFGTRDDLDALEIHGYITQCKDLYFYKTKQPRSRK